MTPRAFYVAGVVDPGQHFVIDRSAWHAEVANKLAAGAFMLLHAPRQSGKSSAVRVIATRLLAEPLIALACTLENLHASTLAETWRNLEAGIHCAMLSYATAPFLRDQHVPALHLSRPLFTDAESFKAFFAADNWSSFRVVLLLDEFDKLLDADRAVREDVLGALRALRTQACIAPAELTPPVALHAVLGIGVYRLVNLTARDADESRTSSPFNVSSVEQVPRTTHTDVETLFHEVESELGICVAPEIVRDVFWRSGGHVGLISLLGQHMMEIIRSTDSSRVLDDASWAECVGGSPFLGAVMHSSTVASMLRSVHRAVSHRQAIDARNLLRTMLGAPDGAALDVDEGTHRGSLDYLLSEGIVTSGVTDTSTHAYGITAPLLVPLLMREVGSFALLSRLPRLPFPRHHDNSVDVHRSVLELLPYISIDALFHPYSLLKSGLPCEDAYHFQLFDLMSHRASEGGWRVLGESRKSQATGPLRRLDLLIASNGRRCGVELLAEGADFDRHVFEQAPAYLTQQRLQRIVVVNFACCATNIIRALTAPPPSNVDVMQVLVDRHAATMTSYVLRDNVFVPLSPQKAVSSCGEVAAAEAEALSSGLRSLSTVTSRTKIAVVNEISFFVTERDTVADLVAIMAAQFDLLQACPSFVHLSADGASFLIADKQISDAPAARCTMS